MIKMGFKTKKCGFCKNCISPSPKSIKGVIAFLLIITAAAILSSAAFADLYLNSQTGNIYLNTTNIARMQIASGGNLILLGQTNVSFPANLTVDSGTLFVDSVSNRVGIGTLAPINALTIIGDVSAFGSLNATYINATEIRVGANIVQVEKDAFKLANYSAEYAAAGFDRDNVTEYLGEDGNASLLRTVNISKDLTKFFTEEGSVW